MNFAPPLVPGRLIRRYKRFLADVELADGEAVTAHCANPGAMTGLAEAGARVWLSESDDPRRKLRYSWRLVEVAGGMACVDTSLANHVVAEGLAEGRIGPLSGYADVRREAPYGARSRVDFLLTDAQRPSCYVEVKSVTLRRGDAAAFPDSVTKRGAKHLAELANMARSGARAVMFYLVQRTDCGIARLAGDIDPAYVAAFREARAAGVETLAWRAEIDEGGVRLGQVCVFDHAA